VTGVGTAKQATFQGKRHIPLAAGASLAVLIFLSVSLFAWFHGGRERMLLLLQPAFTATAIDPQAQTLTLRRAQESFVVSCGHQCGFFAVGKRYTMHQRAGALEFTGKSEKITLPILREHYDFETPPGGHG
jgi:hypothetical protein